MTDSQRGRSQHPGTFAGKWASTSPCARPALIVSVGARPEDIAVSDARKVGLPEGCVIRVVRLTTLSDAPITHRVGSITAKDRNAVSALLKKYLP